MTRWVFIHSSFACKQAGSPPLLVIHASCILLIHRNVPILFGSTVCCLYHLPIFDMNIPHMSMSHNSTNGMSSTKNANICDFR